MHDQLNLYFDGELDAGPGQAFEEHLSACPECTRELSALRQTRTALQDASFRFQPPLTLEDRIRATLDQAQPVPKISRRWKNGLFAAMALAAAVLFGVGLSQALRGPTTDDRLSQEIAAGHARSLLADHLMDIASTDRHTVKPWFQGRIDFAPPVNDLKEQGFPLAGGRLDFIDGRTVAALVYRRRQHVINLFVWPAVDGGESGVKMSSRRGYNLAHWTASGLNFWAVSDLNGEELGEFSRLVRGDKPK